MASDPKYPEDVVGRVELVWGEGFISPGGAGEVRETLAGIEIAGREVLDFGSGLGGVDIVLARELGAGRVVGVDVQPFLVARARALARSQGVDDRVRFQIHRGDSLPFADNSFDVAFSKDAIFHHADRPLLFAELFRVLRPGGRLAVADFLRADGDDLPLLKAYLSAWDPPIQLESLASTEALLAAAGFVAIELRDRCAWYGERIREDLLRMRGELRQAIVERFGEDGYDDWFSVRERMLAALEAGEFRPGHYRARKPG